MIEADVIGSIGAVLTTFCFVPQVYKVLRHRQSDGISLAMYVIYCTGLSFWLAYGFMLENLPIIASNIITLMLALTILTTTYRHRKAKQN